MTRFGFGGRITAGDKSARYDQQVSRCARVVISCPGLVGVTVPARSPQHQQRPGTDSRQKSREGPWKSAQRPFGWRRVSEPFRGKRRFCAFLGAVWAAWRIPEMSSFVSSLPVGELYTGAESAIS
jgi:hypothetical protein